MAHIPELHVGVPLPVVHVVPHVPQLLMLLWVLTSQPSPGLMSQSA
jgi:hypothetical protein